MFHYTVETTNSLESTISKLESSLKEEGFGVLWEFDIKEKLQEKGLNYDEEYKVLEVCNPHEAQRVLQQNKMVGYFLPCKIVVYRDSEKTKVGMPKPSVLMESINDRQLKDLALDIEKRLITCLDNCI